jgi:hypothetical protein
LASDNRGGDGAVDSDRGEYRGQGADSAREYRQHALFDKHSGDPVFQADNGRRRERGRCGADLGAQKRR